MINNLKLSIVIPCYNEEPGLKNILGSAPPFIDEFIVVDNGSCDNTAQVAKSYKAKLFVEKKKGYGRTLLKGLQHATGQIIAITDGDGSYPVKMLEEICIYMKQGGFDFVSGCRFPLTNFQAMPFINMISNYFISCLIRLLFKINLLDSQSGMMVFKRDILGKIEIKNSGMGFSQEIKIKSWLSPHIKCNEYPIPYFPRIGKVKFNKIRDGAKNLYDVLVLWAKFKKMNKLAVTNAFL